jgi:coenzyme F420-0:L-glutamate ligase
MNIKPIVTKIVRPDDNLVANFLDALTSTNTQLQEETVIVVSSKVFSYAENRIVKISNDSEFEELVKKESEIFYGGTVVDLTFKNGLFVANAGIDKSNVPTGSVILWPEDCQKSIDDFRLKLCEMFSLKNLGVIMIDSICLPGRTGVTGAAICYSGIKAVTDERGKNDIYGNPLRITKVNKADAIASAANLLMGEADELTPYCLVTELAIEFSDEKVDSIAELSMPLEECIFNSVYKY